MFNLIEGGRGREDLFLFRTKALPLGKQMLQLLDAMSADQQARLQQRSSATLTGFVELVFGDR